MSLQQEISNIENRHNWNELNKRYLNAIRGIKDENILNNCVQFYNFAYDYISQLEIDNMQLITKLNTIQEQRRETAEFISEMRNVLYNKLGVIC